MQTKCNGRPSMVRPIEVLINLRKSSLRLVRAPSLLPNKEDCEKEQWFHVEFTVDCSVPWTGIVAQVVKVIKLFYMRRCMFIVAK